MEKTEPTFVPEWLKNNGTISHQSSLHTDDQGVSKPLRNKSLDNDLGCPTTSSYFRRPSGNGVNSRSYSSFGRNRDRDNVRRRDYNYSDPLASILPSRFERDGLRHSHSNLSAKHGESWPRNVVGEKNGHNNNGKISLERDFPSLRVEGDSEIGRVPSPGLSNVVQSSPISGDVWTSALAEVPVMVGTNGNHISVQQPIQPTSVSGTTNVITGRNMAETLAQGPPHAQTAPQLSVGTQRLEELAVKQSRQLIPMTPSMPKALASSLSDKPKLKVGQLQHQSSLPRLVSVKSDVSKASSPSSLSPHTVGKLQILKPSRNGTSVPTVKESSCSSPTAGGNIPNSPLAVVGSAPLRNTDVATVERKPCVEKKPSLQAKSRHDFFNLMRKKSLVNNSSVTASDNGSSDSTNDMPGEGGGTEDGPMAVDRSCGVQLSGENKIDLSFNGETERYNNGKNNSGADVILYSEEEEARFLRSLGWEETAEEEGLTEEEINSFYRDVSKYMNSKAASNFFKGTQLESLMPLNLLLEKNGDISPDTTKVDS